MANSLLTISQITRKAAMTLHQKATFLRKMDRQYDDQFGKSGGKIGDTLRVRLPNEYTARSGLTYSAQDTAELKVDLPVSSVRGVDMQFTSLDLALNLDDFNSRFIEPAVSVLAAAVESDVYTNLYKKVYNVYDGDTTAFSFTALNNARQILTENLTPTSGRSVVLTPDHTTKFMTDTKGLFHSSDNIKDQYEEGMIGRTLGFDVYESTILADHTTGTALKATTYTVNGAVTANGSASVVVATGATTFKAGDVFTVAGCFAVNPQTRESTGSLFQFVALADVALNGSGAGTITVAPIYSAAHPLATVLSLPATSSAVVFLGAASTTYPQNIAYHKDAFTLATADLILPQGVDMASRANHNGISMRIVRQYDINNDRMPCRVDVLYGYAAIRPQLACRVWG
jgi:hypothetical protein